MPVSRFKIVVDCAFMVVCFFVFMVCLGMAFRSNTSAPFLDYLAIGMVFLGGTLWLAIEIYRGRWKQ